MVDLPITKWIKKKIRRLIAIVEDTDVATHSIASGKYVVWKGDLYKSTAAIAVGGSLSLSNLSPVSDGGINALSEQLVSKAAASGGTALSMVTTGEKYTWNNKDSAKVIRKSGTVGTVSVGSKTINSIGFALPSQSGYSIGSITFFVNHDYCFANYNVDGKVDIYNDYTAAQTVTVTYVAVLVKN